MNAQQFDFKMVDIAMQFLGFLTTVSFFFLGAMGGIVSYCWLRDALYDRWKIALEVIPYAIVISLLGLISSSYRLIFKSVGARNLQPLTNQMLNETKVWEWSLPVSFPSTAFGLLVVALVVFCLIFVLASKR